MKNHCFGASKYIKIISRETKYMKNTKSDLFKSIRGTEKTAVI